MKKIISLFFIAAACILQFFIRYSGFNLPAAACIMLLFIVCFSLSLLMFFGLDKALWHYIKSSRTAEMSMLDRAFVCGTPLIASAVLYSIVFMFHVRNSYIASDVIYMDTCIGVGLFGIAIAVSGAMGCFFIAKKFSLTAAALFILLAVWQWKFSYYNFFYEWQIYLTVTCLTAAGVILMYFALGFVSLRAANKSSDNDKITYFPFGFTAKAMEKSSPDIGFFVVPILSSVCLWGFSIFSLAVIQTYIAFPVASLYTNIVVSLTFPVIGALISWGMYAKMKKNTVVLEAV